MPVAHQTGGFVDRHVHRWLGRETDRERVVIDVRDEVEIERELGVRRPAARRGGRQTERSVRAGTIDLVEADRQAERLAVVLERDVRRTGSIERQRVTVDTRRE